MAAAEGRDEHPGLMDLAAAHVDPLERVAGVVELDALPGGEVARRHGRLLELGELAVELLPEVGVRRQRLGPLLPDELERVAEPELVQHRRPLDLRHPQRVTGRPAGRRTQAVTNLPHRPPRTAEGTGNLPQAATGAQPPLNLRVPIHREPPPCHAPLPFAVAHDGTGPSRPKRQLRRWSQSRKSSGPLQRKPRSRLGLCN